MQLKDTVQLMLSEDYKDRFKAEYHQTRIRFVKLKKLLIQYKAGSLDFEPSCSVEILEEQANNMESYLMSLEKRAATEGIAL